MPALRYLFSQMTFAEANEHVEQYSELLDTEFKRGRGDNVQIPAEPIPAQVWRTMHGRPKSPSPMLIYLADKASYYFDENKQLKKELRKAYKKQGINEQEHAALLDDFAALQRNNEDQESDIENKAQEIKAKTQEIENKSQEIKEKTQEVEGKNQEIEMLEVQNQTLKKRLSRLDTATHEELQETVRILVNRCRDNNVHIDMFDLPYIQRREEERRRSEDKKL